MIFVKMLCKHAIVRPVFEIAAVFREVLGKLFSCMSNIQTRLDTLNIVQRK